MKTQRQNRHSFASLFQALTHQPDDTLKVAVKAARQKRVRGMMMRSLACDSGAVEVRESSRALKTKLS